jgi:hypothetical protein
MKLLSVENKIHSEGAIKTKQFGMRLSPKMAHMLSDQMYNNKVRALIRELSTNAYDSHISAGNPNAFDVHLPTTYEQYFYIRDYGTGMSPETIDDIYLNYGESNKENSNELVGCMGLGSKTPFCYHTRTATVEVWYDGMHSVYNLYYNSESMPCCDLVIQNPSDEPTGVKVQVPVKSYDFYNFDQEAQYVYCHFKLKPNFVGKKLEIKDTVYLLKGSNWGYHNNSTSNVIMGNVCYPINVTSLGYEDVGGPKYNIGYRGFDIHVNIGDVDIITSREGLSYNDLTKARVKQYITDITTELSKQVEDKIQSATSLWDARCQFNNVLKGLGSLSNTIDTNLLTWQNNPLGLNIGGSIDLLNELKYYKDTVVYKMRFDNHRKKFKHDATNRVHPTTKIVVNDLKTGIIGRIEAYSKSISDDVYFIRQTNDNPTELASMLKFLGCSKDDVILASTLPAPVRNYSGGSGIGKMTKVIQFVRNNYRDKPTEYWKDTTVDLDNGGVYVDFYRYAVYKDGVPFNALILKEMLNSLEALDIDIPDIYGIRKCDADKLEGEWINVFDWIREQYDSIKDDHSIDPKQITSYKEELDDAQVFTFNTNHSYYSLKGSNVASWKSNTIDKFNEDCKTAEKYTKELDKARKLEYIELSLGISRPKSQTLQKLGLVSQLEAIRDRYPMLRFCTKEGYRIQTIQDYINLVENK